MQVDYALLVCSSHSHSQKQQTYICDCVSVTLKTNHIHNCHAMLPAHKTHSYNWLFCTAYPLWTGQMGNANNYLVAGRKSNPWPSQWWSNVTNYFKHWEDKSTVQSDSNEISVENRQGETKYSSLLAVRLWQLWYNGKPPPEKQSPTCHTTKQRHLVENNVSFHSDQGESHSPFHTVGTLCSS